MKKLIVLLISFIFVSSASAAIYTWVDEKGVTNFVDDYSKIPSAYRNKAEKASIPKTGPLTPSSASAAIYRWVDEKGVVNFTDDYSKIPSAYRNKAEKVSIPKTGPLTPSQFPPGQITASVQSRETATQAPPIAQPLIREGDFAMKLAEVLKMGQAKNEAEAESMLATVGITPKNGWIADYPVTPDIIGELRSGIGGAVDSRKLGMNRDEAVKALQDLAAQQGLPVKVDERQNPIEPPQDYGEPEVVNNYYYTEGPPIVTYYPPPWDYSYLYAWVPYPFWYTGFWFPGFFILTDFHIHHGHHFISNHFVDPKTHASLRVDPRTRATGTSARTAGGTSSRGFTSLEARRGATSIFNRSANARTFSQPSNTGRQYRSFHGARSGSGTFFSRPPTRSFSTRSFGTPSSGSFSSASRGGRGSSGSSRGGSYSGGFHGGDGFGGSHGGGHR